MTIALDILRRHRDECAAGGTWVRPVSEIGWRVSGPDFVAIFDAIISEIQAAEKGSGE